MDRATAEAWRLLLAGWDTAYEFSRDTDPDHWPLRSHLELAALDTAPGCARAHVSAVLHEWHADADLTDAAALIVSELLTNAVISTRAHGRPDPVRLWVLGSKAGVLFLAWDATMPAPVLDPAAPDAEHGRGLALIDALSARWGFYHPAEPPGGKVVWAFLETPSLPVTAAGLPLRVPEPVELDSTRPVINRDPRVLPRVHRSLRRL